jgi:hypothetical protein
MDTNKPAISSATRKRLETQGYLNFSDNELADHRFGIRFAYWLCILLVMVGLFMASIPVLIAAAGVAFVGAVLPRHPFDYLYNYGVRKIFSRPHLPPRTSQGRFSCGVASVWLAAIIYFLNAGQPVVANVLGVVLVAVGLLVSSTDICIPSMIYNGLKRKRIEAK